MHTATWLLALLGLAVVPAIAAPCDKGCGGSTKIVKRGDSSRSLMNEGSSSEDEIYQKSACGGEYAKKSKGSNFKSVAKSADNSYESFSATAPGHTCGRTLIARKCGESDYDYYRRAFVIDESCGCEDKILVFYKSVFQQYEGECDADYVKRVEYIFTKCYPRLDCRYNIKYENLLNKYYLIRYAKLATETDELYFKRCLTRTTESETVYKSKVQCMKKYITNVNWSRFQIDTKSSTGYTIVTQSTTKSLDSSCGCQSQKKTIITEEEVKKSCARLAKEDDKTYFTRILRQRSSFKTTEEYITYCNHVRKCYPKIKVWYSPEYSDLIKDYYTTLYTRKSGEKDEIYYQRLATKEEYESVDEFAKRLEVIRCIYPTSPLFTDKTFYEKYSKIYFKTIYNKYSTEDDNTYFNRIVSRCNGESDLVYINRLDLVRCTYPHLKIWYSKDYLDQIRKYYTVKYLRQTSEPEVQFYQRIVTQESWESDEEFANRVECVRQLYPDYGVFYKREYYDKSKKYFQTYYKQFSYEKDLKTYYKRISSRCAKESDVIYLQRLKLVEECHSDLSLWYSEEYLDYVSPYYKLKYTRLSGEKDQVYIKRVFTRCGCDKSDLIFAKRLHVVHLCTASESFWYDEQYYEQFTKTYYSEYYKKGDEACDLWLRKVITLLKGECEEYAIKRIALIRKCHSSCGCWTADYLNKIQSYFSAEYIKQIRSKFFLSKVEITKKSSSSKSSVKEGSSSDEEISIRRGGGCN